MALAEVGGAIARRTGNSELGEQALQHLLALSALQIVVLDESLGRSAAQIAARLRLRGMDAIYVATAHALNQTLVTWDQEQLQRGSALVQCATPAALLSQQPDLKPPQT